MKIFLALTAISAVLLVSGCASTSTTPRTSATVAATAAVPKVPLASLVPPDYRTKVVAYAAGTLKDPYSIKSAEISGPRQVFVGLLNGGQVPGVCVKMNAKNSFGAYIGVQPLIVAFKNGEVFYSAPPVFGDCDNAVYAPFPELEQIS